MDEDLPNFLEFPLFEHHIDSNKTYFETDEGYSKRDFELIFKKMILNTLREFGPDLIIINYPFSFSKKSKEESQTTELEPELFETLIKMLRFSKRVTICCYAKLFPARFFDTAEENLKSETPDSPNMYQKILANIKKSAFDWDSSQEIHYFGSCIMSILRGFFGKSIIIMFISALLEKLICLNLKSMNQKC